jgi:hypothetical protein
MTNKNEINQMPLRGLKGNTMKYIVIASYQKPTAPMLYEDAVQLVEHLRAQGINCHIQTN